MSRVFHTVCLKMRLAVIYDNDQILRWCLLRRLTFC